jgi:hypothetical protein
MANLKISQLTQRTPDGQEYIEVIIPPFGPGDNRKVLVSDLATIIGWKVAGTTTLTGNTIIDGATFDLDIATQGSASYGAVNGANGSGVNAETTGTQITTVVSGVPRNAVQVQNNHINLLLTDDLHINSDPGTSGQVLTSNGSATPPTWETPSGGGGTPGGSDTQLQYNNAGAFGGITGATTNGTALTLVAPALGTPASATLTNATGLPVSTGISGLGTGVATFLATPSSANLRSAITDESGTGALIFADGNIGAATATTPASGDDDTSVATTEWVNDWATVKRVVLDADVINSNASANTLADITNLGFPVVAGTYAFKFVIDYTSAATTTGSGWSINGPTATRINFYLRVPITSSTESVQHGLNAYNAYTVTGQSPTNTQGVAIIEGFITVTASGTVIGRFSSEVSSSAVTAKAGSYVEYQKVA